MTSYVTVKPHSLLNSQQRMWLYNLRSPNSFMFTPNNIIGVISPNKLQSLWDYPPPKKKNGNILFLLKVEKGPLYLFAN